MVALGVIPPVQLRFGPRSLMGFGGCSHTSESTDRRSRSETRASDQGQPGGHAQWL